MLHRYHTQPYVTKDNVLTRNLLLRITKITFQSQQPSTGILRQPYDSNVFHLFIINVIINLKHPSS